MPDISMCNGHLCPKRDECYRCQAIPCYVQSYAEFESICLEEEFKHFIAINGKRVRDHLE